MEIPAVKNQEIRNNLNFGERIDIADKIINRRFDFKIKVTQKDLTPNDDFYWYFKNLNDSSVPFMVQHSEYIEKLEYLNSFGGASLADESIIIDRGFEDMVFQADIANQEVLREVERRKDEMFDDMISMSGGSAEDFVRNMLDDLAEKIAEYEPEEPELEDVDINGNLYMYNMVNGVVAEEYFEDVLGIDFDAEAEEHEFEESGNNYEVKFSTCGSINLLEGNMLEVKYDESDMTGIKDAFVRFLFDLDRKDCVTIHRCGHADTWLNCEKGERIEGRPRGFGGSMTVDTKEIINNMGPDGGQLLVSYVRETNGAPAELVTHVISASPVRE